MAVWNDIIPEQDKEILYGAGFGKRKGFGRKPALMVIDALYNFIGDKPEPIADSTKRFPMSCGDVGWRAIHEIAELLPLVRSKNIPVIYSTGDPTLPAPWLGKSRAQKTRGVAGGNEIVKKVAPHVEDIIIRKLAPSIFFGTPLVGILVSLGIDTVICCGGVTSGCIRASVVDACSYGLKVGVIEECTFDRSEICHKVNLFDMSLKYATVISANEFKTYVDGIIKT